MSLGKDFFGERPKTQVTKTKLNNWDYNKLNIFCTVKGTISNNKKRQPTEWETIFPNYISVRVNNQNM